MPGILKVFIVPNSLWPLYDLGPGGWQLDGQGPTGPGSWYAGGFLLTPVADGPHTITFEPEGASFLPNPNPVMITMTDGVTLARSGSYNVSGPETLLESGTAALIETKTYALDTALGSPLFFAASSMDAAFSGAPAYESYPQGEAKTAATVMGAFFDEVYPIVLEGGQEGSDFATQEELDAIAEIVTPWLTPSGEALPGGVPIRSGYLLLARNIDSWKIQRGKGFSLQPAIDAGYLAGVPADMVMQAWSITETPPPPQPQIVAGFAVAFNGETYGPGQNTGPVGGGDQPIYGMPIHAPGQPIVSGYAASGGANASQPTNLLCACSIHTVNDDDDSINACFAGPGFAGAGALSALGGVVTSWRSNFNYDAAYPYWTYVSSQMLAGVPGVWDSNYSPAPIDWYNRVMFQFDGPPSGALGWITSIPPQYYIGSPDWTWTWTGPSGQPGAGQWTLQWNGTNAQVNEVPLVMIFWIGLTYADVPQVAFTGPIAATPGPGVVPPAAPASPEPFQVALNAYNACSPADRNARVVATTNGKISPFNISLTNPPSASSYQLFSLE